jgi:hypothetical protein
MLKLLLRELAVRPSSYVTAIHALEKSGRFEDGVTLFFEYLAGKTAVAGRSSLLKKLEVEDNEVGEDSLAGDQAETASVEEANVQEAESVIKAVQGPINVALATAALSCCAKGRLGAEALQILSLLENRGRVGKPELSGFSEGLADASRFLADSPREPSKTYHSGSSDLSLDGRLLEYVVTALATPESVGMVPMVLNISVSNPRRSIIIFDKCK